MSKHPLDVGSLAFGTIFVVMALVGLAEAAELVDEGLIVTLIGIVVAAAVVGVVVSIRRISSDGPSPDDLSPTGPPDEVPPTGDAPATISAQGGGSAPLRL